MVDSIHGNKGMGPIKSLKATQGAESTKGKAGSAENAKADFASALSNADKAASAQAAQKAAKTARPGVSVGVEFSPVMHDMAKASEEMDAERAAKVQSLKQQVSSGNYKPDLNKVAASLLYFIARGN